MHQVMWTKQRAIQFVAAAFSFAQLVALLLFLRFVRAADLVSAKSGAADFTLWERYDSSANDALIWLLFTWIASLAFTYALVHEWRKNLFIWFGVIMPLAGVFVYAVFLALVPVH